MLLNLHDLPPDTVAQSQKRSTLPHPLRQLIKPIAASSGRTFEPALRHLASASHHADSTVPPLVPSARPGIHQTGDIPRTGTPNACSSSRRPLHRAQTHLY
ncbi:hypothetical protein PCANC_21858 [Puccinia coronata f. sp. avenae]|uniref:Uncharacterized protein n=1 Tax=Puccinia coronata f. sp. avenae TaxID=200324 RepID=A0A2N5SRU0_9BASI|nr:hypothetical protein PCANC_21858 [Puccinia coronata f. sp. avenae]PLW15963.1 hypothetical protein PCASD_18986 [Puccinia coronata f. sp. avenae]PLW32682.1 hypothetical protein PCASD_16824 [Puccinia coronata f. sp. avenae]